MFLDEFSVNLILWSQLELRSDWSCNSRSDPFCQSDSFSGRPLSPLLIFYLFIYLFPVTRLNFFYIHIWPLYNYRYMLVKFSYTGFFYCYSNKQNTWDTVHTFLGLMSGISHVLYLGNTRQYLLIALTRWDHEYSLTTAKICQLNWAGHFQPTHTYLYMVSIPIKGLFLLHPISVETLINMSQHFFLINYWSKYIFALF